MLHADKFKPHVLSLQSAVIVHQYTKCSISLSTSKAGEATVATEAGVAPTGAGDPHRAAGPNSGKTTSTVQPLCVNTAGEPHTTPGRSAEP